MVCSSRPAFSSLPAWQTLLCLMLTLGASTGTSQRACLLRRCVCNCGLETPAGADVQYWVCDRTRELWCRLVDACELVVANHLLKVHTLGRLHKVEHTLHYSLCAVFYMHWLQQDRVAPPAWQCLTSSTHPADLKALHCPAEACIFGPLL